MQKRHTRRLFPVHPHTLYARAAHLERLAVAHARARESRRMRLLGTEIAGHLEQLADRQAETRRAA